MGRAVPTWIPYGVFVLTGYWLCWLRLAYRHKKVLENTNPSHSLPALERELFRAQVDKVKHVLLYKLRILLHSAQFFLNSSQLWLFTGHFMSFCHLFCQCLFFFSFPCLLMLQCWQYWILLFWPWSHAVKSKFQEITKLQGHRCVILRGVLMLI